MKECHTEKRIAARADHFNDVGRNRAPVGGGCVTFSWPTRCFNYKTKSQKSYISRGRPTYWYVSSCVWILRWYNYFIIASLSRCDTYRTSSVISFDALRSPTLDYKGSPHSTLPIFIVYRIQSQRSYILRSSRKMISMPGIGYVRILGTGWPLD